MAALHRSWRGGLLFDDLLQGGHGRGGVERRAAGQQPVQDGAEAEHVAAVVSCVAPAACSGAM